MGSSRNSEEEVACVVFIITELIQNAVKRQCIFKTHTCTSYKLRASYEMAQNLFFFTIFYRNFFQPKYYSFFYNIRHVQPVFMLVYFI